eukprot:18159-Heterococcus_DN1.PRE.5
MSQECDYVSDESYAENEVERGPQCAEVRCEEWLDVAFGEREPIVNRKFQRKQARRAKQNDVMENPNKPAVCGVPVPITGSTLLSTAAMPTHHQQDQQSTAREFLSMCDRESSVTADVSSELKQSTKAVHEKLKMLLQLAIAGHYDEPFRTDAVAQIVSKWSAQYASALVWKLDCLMYWFNQGYFSSDDRQEYAVHAWELLNTTDN